MTELNQSEVLNTLKKPNASYNSSKTANTQYWPLARRPGFDPWVTKIPLRREWQPTPVFLSGESHGQRSLAGYSPWAHKKSDMAEQTINLKNKINLNFRFKKKNRVPPWWWDISQAGADSRCRDREAETAPDVSGQLPARSSVWTECSTRGTCKELGLVRTEASSCMAQRVYVCARDRTCTHTYDCMHVCCLHACGPTSLEGETRIRRMVRTFGKNPSIHPWRRNWQSTTVLLPREFRGQRSLVACCP